ncbi:MAG: transaldolase family protein [Cytophagales bacterium]
MELYLDSVDFKEVEESAQLGIIAGLTTTPTFMHRHGITDIDAAIVKLSKMVPVLQIEALGNNPDEILAEAERQLALGLDPKKTVFKIPVSNIGVAACKKLRDKGYLVNVHLVYTLNQAYLAMEAGATYVCPLAGRMQDNGIDALTVFAQILDVCDKYAYNTKVMFSSVRNTEHVRNALELGVHTVTAPWSVIKKLNDNNLTTLGTNQFIEHTKLMTIRVKEVTNKENTTVSNDTTLTDALVKMTESGLGAVSIVDASGNLKGVFTDGDLRRKVKEQGKDVLSKKMSDFEFKNPVSVNGDALLYDAVKLFKDHQVDTIVVTEDNKPFGMIDIQDFVKMGLIG